MSQRCNLSTRALRESVSPRRPPINPTPIPAASTVFTALASRLCLPAHKNHDAAAGATFHTSGCRERRRQAKYALGELRVDFRQHGRDHTAHQPQRLRARRGRDRYVGRPVEFEAGVLDDLRDAMAGMDANEPETPPRAIETKQAATVHQRDRAARAKYVVGTTA